MKRHPALVPLSHDHHRELVQARRLRRAAGASPAARAAAGAAYADAFFRDTIAHFRREEEQLFPLYARRTGRTPTLDRILAEHMQLIGLAHALRAEAAAGDVGAERLRQLADLLAAHVRVEERELFEEIQRVLSEDELDAFGRAHTP